MKKFEDDIEVWIKNKYPDTDKAKEIIEPLLGIDTAINISRIIRCALYLSDSDYDSLVSYTNKALDDPRNVLWWAETDNRNVQKRDFNYSFTEQK
jgi:squalene cyclase